MRVQVEYDDHGVITSVAGAASFEFPDGSHGTLGRIAAPGRRIVDLEVEHIRHERDVAGFRKLVEEYVITGHPHKPRLTHK
jgi:hypothetical protein